MDLSAGTRLGAYRIDGPLGAGGMGKVYRATHLELGRSVAIKMVAEEVARNPVALARFRREARAASRLSHPHICTVHDFSEEGGRPFLVLELIPGETLEERLRRGPMALEEALRVGAEIGEALAHAHARGLLHRDLKPGNVMLTDAGAKVLDFGLAKAARPAPGEGEAPPSLRTVTAEASVPGTVPYMAPEQLDGKDSDARSDVWALGVVLYEMLAGRRPFAGSTNATLAAAILAASPPSLQSLRPDAPRALVRIVERCLERRPERRFQSPHDVALNLRWLEEDLEGRPGVAVAAPPRRRGRRLLGGLLAGLAGTAAVLLVGVKLLSGPSSGERVTFTLNLPAGVEYAEGSRNVPVVSPDGDRVVFVATDSLGQSGLWLRALGASEAVPVRGAGRGVMPFWSPDGRSLGFSDWSSLKALPVGGGPVRTLAPVTVDLRGATWGREGDILFAPDPASGLRRVSQDGGAVTEVSRPDRAAGEIGHLWPQFLPDGDRFLYFVSSASESVRGIYVSSLSEPRTRRRLVGSEASGVYAQGFLLFLQDGDLYAQRLDVGGRRLEGVPHRVAEGVAVTDGFRGAFSASPAGVLSFSSREGKNFTELALVGPDGERLSTVGPAREQRNPVLAPGGDRLALEAWEGTTSEIELVDLATGRSRGVMDARTRSLYPVWGPAGERLAFLAGGEDGWSLQVLQVDRVDAPAPVLRSEVSVMPTSWSPDGRYIAYNVVSARGDFDVRAVDLVDGIDSLPLLTSPANEVNVRFDPTGRRLAYMSSETGVFEVYVEPFPRTGRRCAASAGGGGDPAWSSDGRTLHYLRPDGEMMTAAVPERGCPATPRPRFRTRVATPGTSRNHYDVLADGRMVVNQRPRDPVVPELHLILNWAAEIP